MIESISPYHSSEAVLGYRLMCVSIFVIHIQVLIWDVDAQPNRHAVLGATESRPDLV